MDANSTDGQWWRDGVVYQIYPRSFKDTTGNGVGDLPGVVEKVDYLDDLGVDVVWLCPVYDSPNADNGYDIRDYRSIMDEMGTMADWERLRDELHERDIKLIMDLVVNHTSDEHEWFQRSRRREGKYEDYYYWRDGRPADEADYETDDGPADEVAPNNWESIFGGPAWSYDEVREQWYLHLFVEKQPDLNWRNPDVRGDVKEMIEWWLEKGIDGFRLDAINLLSKPDGLPDGDPDEPICGGELFYNGPRMHEYLQELRDDVFAHYDLMTVGEMDRVSVEDVKQYCEDGLDMIFQFEHMNLDLDESRFDPPSWTLSELKSVFSRWQTGLAPEGWDALYFGNHDQPRIVSRFGDDGEYREESAKLIATFLMTLRGTPFVYQGEEIGMTNADFETFDEVDDPPTRNFVQQALDDGTIDDYQEARPLVNARSRDNARTPMQWSDEANAGFTAGEPWLKVNENYREINVADARAREDSIWHYYRRLIDLRHEHDVLVSGEYELLLPEHENLYAYTRTLGDDEVLVVLNWAGEETEVDLSAGVEAGDVLVGNYADPPASPDGQTLRPYEAVVYRR